MSRKIKLLERSNLDSVVYTLLSAQARGKSVYIEFKGHKLYSDEISMDSAFLEVFGQTKADYDKAEEEKKKKYAIDQEQAKQQAIDKIPNWIEKGQSLIYPERYDEWGEYVKTRVGDLFHGEELDASLEIMQAIENGASIEEASKMLEGNGGSFNSLVRNTLFHFSSKGPEFWKATADGKVSRENKQALKAKKAENARLAKINSKGNSVRKHL